MHTRNRYYPWNGTHNSVTVSPAVTAFDLGTSVACADNPLRQRDFTTFMDVEEDRPLTLRYSLTCTCRVCGA